MSCSEPAVNRAVLFYASLSKVGSEGGVAVETPWGDLAGLDPLDRDLAFRILSQDKHQLLEGLVVENTFDQIIRPLATGTGPTLRPLDVDTVVARGDSGWLAFVWTRSPSTTVGLGRYLLGLEQVADVYLLVIEAGTFVARRSFGGKRSNSAVPLHTLLARLTGRAPILPRVSRMVRDVERQQTAFWGFLNTTYPGKRLWNEVVLFRLLINCGIQSFFRGVWNLDRICLYEDQPGTAGQLWMLEVKHKYPIRGVPLKFGINDGEVQMMKLAALAGVRTMGNPPTFNRRQKWSYAASANFWMGVMPPSAMFGRSWL